MDLFIDRSTGRLRALWRLAIQYLAFRVLVLLFVNLLVVAWLLASSGGRISSGGLDRPASPIPRRSRSSAV